MSDRSSFGVHVVTLGQDGGVLGAPSSSSGAGETAPGGVGGDATGGGGGPAGGGSFFFIMIAMMVGLILLTSMSGRKEKKKHAAMVGGLKKKDKVRAAGGIIGTIVEIKNDELLLETDRASNTRIRVARGSVSSVLSEGPAAASEGSDAETETVKN
jgi:preprotein translocase subunit YajC